jgi:hypothetical protein
MEVINGRVQTCFRNMTHYGEHVGLFLRENPLVIVQIKRFTLLGHPSKGLCLKGTLFGATEILKDVTTAVQTFV